ncbi:4-hydroxy-3-methylbut-2-enyl diphosphate reductase [bacterium]|nr:4-hydroxy-3-methylbut-2-enyl diphosphate reductase [bacterium]
MSKKITLAKFAGFCYGVKRAVETVKKLKLENPNKNIFVLGELIHNSQVIKELEELGIRTVDVLPENETGICVIRSHGASPEVIEDIQNRGFELVDLTCPDVKKVQQQAVQLAKEGDYVIIVGKAEHPEVVAIKANAQKFTDKISVIADVSQLENIKDEIKIHKKVGVVVQTTQRLETLQSIVTALIAIAKEIHLVNTICQSTTMRQNEAKELAQSNDMVVVVGSKKSANTTHLAEILQGISKTVHIENDDELANYKELLEDSENVAITAGASTPQNIIDNVYKKIEGGQE